MSKSSVRCPNHKDNPKRSEAKLKKGRGILAMRKEKKNHAEWAQSFDPLFRIKGIERHRRMKQV